MSTLQTPQPAASMPTQGRKRSAPKVRKERPAKQPKIVKPPPKSLNDLPEEVLAVVAFYLEPVSLLTGTGVISPLERPYAPHHKAITANHAFRNERFGAIPSSLIDLISFARSCRLAMKVSLKTISGIGVSRKPEKLESMDGRFLPIANMPKRQLFIRMDHITEAGNNLSHFMLDHRETLEEIVMYNCGSHDSNKSRNSSYSHEIADPATLFNRSAPLQELCKDEDPLPALQRVQLGPDLCIACVRAALRLFTAKRFAKQRSGFGSSVAATGWDLAHAPNHWNQEVTNFDHYPAPSLRSIQIIIPDIINTAQRISESSRLNRMFEGIPDETAKQLETFSVVLRGQMDRRWGGFGVAGGTTRVNGKTREQAEADLTERARMYMTTPGTSAWEKQREEKEKGVVAKYADKLKAAKAAPAAPKKDDGMLASAVAARKDDDLLAAAAAAISTIQSRDKGKGKAVDVEKGNDKGKGRGAQDDGACTLVNGHPGKGPRMTAFADEASVGESSASARLDKGKARELPATLDIAAMADGLDPDLKDASDSEVDPDEEVKVEHVENEENGESSNGPKRRERRRNRADGLDPLGQHDKNADSNHLRLEEQMNLILQSVARKFPSLVSLQVVRGGSNRTDVVEGEDSMERMLRCCVQPLKDLESLRHLDLGLAVVGRREVRDFPIGLNIPVVDPARAAAQYGPIQARSLMLRKRLHDTDILKAVKEGDAWRKKVIERFALGKGDPILAVGNNLDDDAPPKPITWPRGVQSGCVYSPDLIERIKYRGFLMCWEKDMVNGVEVLKWKRRNVIL